MINFYISYFYQIRNMKPNMLPVSTAMLDPKWFHYGRYDQIKFTDPCGSLISYDVKRKYIDKNGVINGVRMIDLIMPLYKWEELVKRNESCEHCRINNGAAGDLFSGMCPFMQEYANCIREKNPDFQKFITFCDGYLQFLNQHLNLCLDTIIFIVHEAPSKGCGERPELQRWFAENGMELKEWSKDDK